MRNIYLYLLCLPLIFGACVSQKKFNEVALLKDRAEIENEQLQKRIRLNEELISRLQQSDDQLRFLEKEHDRLQTSYQNVYAEKESIEKRCEDLLEQNRRIMTNATGEKEQLMKELSDQQQLLDRKEQELRAIEKALIEREQKLTELTARMQSQDAKLAEVRNKVNQALLGFSAADLSVHEKNGKVYVSLSQNLLFPKGSKAIDKKGVEALSKLGEVLAANDDIYIHVEGHTDTDGSADLNWDLSVSRATSVTKVLTSSGANPARITAAGRAFFDPVAPNDTEANKSLNRRTDIILSPKLDELFDIIRN